MKTYPQLASTNIGRFSRWGEWAANLGIFIFCVYVIFCVTQLIFVDSSDSGTYINHYTAYEITSQLNISQIIILAFVRCAPTFLIFAIIFVARRLFITYRTEGVFIEKQTERIRFIGWLLFAVAPISVLFKTIGFFLTSSWFMQNNIAPSITVNETHIYTFIIGFVLVTIGHVSREAVVVYNENKSFV